MKRTWDFLKAKPNFVALLGYAVVTALMTLPVATRLTTHLVGWGNDPYVHYWNTWWVEEALSRGVSPYYTDMLFHPNGASLVYHNFAWLNIAGGLALKPFIGPVGAYNVVFLANITLCGFAMYHLVTYVVGQRAAAFVAGLVHAFWPYRLHHSAHPNLISTQWMVWFLLFLTKVVREQKRRHVLLAALFLTLTAFARLQLLIMAMFPAAIYVLYSFLAERHLWSWETAGRVAMIGVLTGVALAYPVYPLIRERFAGSDSQALIIDEDAYDQSDVLAYVMPNLPHPLRDYYAPDILRTQIVFAGYATLALAIYGTFFALRRVRSDVTPWLLIGGFSFLMALGPSLRFRGKVYPGIPLPYRLLGWSFPVRIMRSPHRFNILLAIPIAVLVGFGIRAIRPSPKRRSWVAPAAAGLILFEFLRVPMPTLALDHSSYYERLSAAPEDSAVLDLPMGFSGPAKFYMYLQTIHRKPIVQGKMARPPQDINAFIDGDRFTEHLRATGKTIDDDLTAVSKHLAYLADAGVRYVILHRDPQLEEAVPSEGDWADWKAWLRMRPWYEDQRVAVYPTRPQYGRDFEFAVGLGEDVGIIGVGEIDDVTTQGESLGLDLWWGSRRAPLRDLEARVSLIGEDGTPVMSKVAPLCEDWPSSEWPSGAIAIGRYRFHLGPHLAPGHYELTVELTDTGRSISIGQVEVQALPRVFDPPEQMGHRVSTRFGDLISLLGYDLTPESDNMRVTLHWRALRRMENSYKVFVHVLDPNTGVVVAQKDFVPRDWSYPTTWWEAGEVVSDAFVVSVEEVPPGDYRLVVGIYHPDSGKRLPVTGGQGGEEGQDRLMLRSVSIQ